MFSWIRNYLAEVCALPSALLVYRMWSSMSCQPILFTLVGPIIFLPSLSSSKLLAWNVFCNKGYLIFPISSCFLYLSLSSGAFPLVVVGAANTSAASRPGADLCLTMRLCFVRFEEVPSFFFCCC